MRMRTLHRQSGFTLVEVMIAATVLTIVMASMIVGMQQEAKNLGDLVTNTHRERSAQVVMHRIEMELEFAAGATTDAWTSGAVNGGSSSMVVDNSLGFPPIGTLLVDPGGLGVERIDYTGLNRTTHTFTGMTRGVQCTNPSAHANGIRVHWAGGATALENQIAPPASTWDGQAASPTGPVFFRGDGTGFSFRVPTDPGGGNDYFDATGIRWGSEVDGAPNANGWSCLWFQPIRQLTEAQANRDINEDGDTADVFDVGQIQLLRWDSATNGGGVTRVNLCPPIVLQEVCNYGGDLDADGFADPIFLWNPFQGSLSIQMFITPGMHNQRASIKRIATTLYLRNGAL